MSLTEGERPYYDTYDDFLTSHYWKHLKKQFIYSNPGAKCFICSKTSTLLLHHITYNNLHSERLFRDVYILCYDCHKQAHFYKIFGIFTLRVPMNRRALLKRVLELKSKYLAQKGKYVSSGWYLFRYMITF